MSLRSVHASNISTTEERTRALGLVGGAGGLGFILGPALAALAALLVPTLLVAALVSGVTLLLTLLWLREPLRRPESKEKGASPADGVPLSGAP